MNPIDLSQTSIEEEVFEAKLKFTEQLVQLIAEKGINRVELAEKMGVRPSFVTKVLGGDNNFTFETATKLCHALGEKFEPMIGEGLRLPQVWDAEILTNRPDRSCEILEGPWGAKAVDRAADPWATDDDENVVINDLALAG